MLIHNGISDDGEENSNGEKTESFMVFFPDGTMSFTNGEHNIRNRTWFARIVMYSGLLPFSRSTLGFRMLAMKEKGFDSKN